MNRPADVAALRARLHAALTESERLLVPLQDADLARRTDGWTVAQVLEHVCLTADLYLMRLRPALDRLRDRPPHPAGAHYRTTWVGRLLAGGVDPASTRRLKAPGRFRPADVTKPGLRDHLLRLHLELLGLLDSAAALPLDGVKLRTPVSPLLRLNAWEAFLVLTLHLERHLGQIRRILDDA